LVWLLLELMGLLVGSSLLLLFARCLRLRMK
jgi:hypothetical protein